MIYLRCRTLIGTFCLISASLGCGERALPRQAIEGEVLYQDAPIPQGTIRLVPIEGTLGPASSATIKEGQFRLDANGGAVLGKHRVEIHGEQPTGKVYDDDILGPVVETKPVVPELYSGAESPLQVEIVAGKNEPLRFVIP